MVICNCIYFNHFDCLVWYYCSKHPLFFLWGRGADGVWWLITVSNKINNDPLFIRKFFSYPLPRLMTSAPSPTKKRKNIQSHKAELKLNLNPWGQFQHCSRFQNQSCWAPNCKVKVRDSSGIFSPQNFKPFEQIRPWTACDIISFTIQGQL